MQILLYDRDYETVYAKLDIVEVRPDGYWGDAPAHGWNKSTFLLLNVPGEPVNGALMESLLDSDDITVLRKRRFQIDGTKVPANALKKLREDREDTVPATWVAAYLKDYSDGTG
jgi:hypothetical protein